MAAETLTDLIESLSPEEQDAVRQFVQFLKHKPNAGSPFRTAAEEFINQHPELLRRLAE